jgi:hypothetical protein
MDIRGIMIVLGVSIVGGLVPVSVLYGLYALVYRLVRGKDKKRPAVGLILFMALWMILIALIAIPDFLKFQAPARSSEVKTNLGAIFTSQVNYFDKYNVYAGGQNAFYLLGWKDSWPTTYAYFCGDDFVGNTKGEIIHRSDVPDGVASSATGFTCAAVGNIDNDPDLDYWIINDAKVISNMPSSDL